MMYDWNEMAVLVGKKLVENGQERILQRVFDRVSSGLCLDVSNFKESSSHKLLHLVWRKYPRNGNSHEGTTTTDSSLTQTEEHSSAGLLKSVIAGNSFAPETEWQICYRQHGGTLLSR